MNQGKIKTDCHDCWHCRLNGEKVYCDFEGKEQKNAKQHCLGFFSKSKPMNDENIRVYVVVTSDEEDQMQIGMFGSRKAIVEYLNGEFKQHIGEICEDEEANKIKWEGFVEEDFRERIGTLNWDFRVSVCFDDGGVIDVRGMTVSLAYLRATLKSCEEEAIRRIKEGKE